jgi:hypothetical protein
MSLLIEDGFPEGTGPRREVPGHPGPPRRRGWPGSRSRRSGLLVEFGEPMPGGYAEPWPEPWLLSRAQLASFRGSGMALPVLALRTSGRWQVRLLIPQRSARSVRAGQGVTISVPAARLTGVRGTIRKRLPAPVSSPGSASYQAVVRSHGRARITPLSGMTADVQLGSPP